MKNCSILWIVIESKECLEQIKNQINDINNSLLNNSNINDYSGNKKNIIINCTPEDYIEEKEEENNEEQENQSLRPFIIDFLNESFLKDKY